MLNKIDHIGIAVHSLEEAIPFYEALGFVRAGKTEPMWIYAGSEH